MSWFFLSLICAFFTATSATLSKLLLERQNVVFVGWVRFLVSIPLLFFIVFITKSSFSFSGNFWKTVIILLPIELVAFFLYLYALKLSPISLTFPFLGLTPVFTILTSAIILKERLGSMAILGVFLVSAGAYLLNADAIEKGFLEPIKNIYREKGSLLMVMVAFIYGTTSALGKKAILLSNPVTFPAVYYGLFLLLLTPLVAIKKNALNIKLEKRDIILISALGISFALAMILHCRAMSLAKVSYMISVKRFSLVLSVIFGALVFKEKNIMPRMLGSLIITTGIAILLLTGA